MFAKLYPEIFKPVWEEACRIQNAKGGHKLAIWHKTATRLWREAAEEQRRVVNQRFLEEAEEREGDGDGDDTPESFQQ